MLDLQYLDSWLCLIGHAELHAIRMHLFLYVFAWREQYMKLNVGEKVAYPNQGVCLVEEFKSYVVAGNTMSGYSLRVLNDNSTIFVPEANASCIGIRPLMSAKECKRLIDALGQDFELVSLDWKTRSKEFIEKLRSGDLFEVADVLKKLTFLSHEKKLSFREQTLMEKARFLIVSEITNADRSKEKHVDSEVARLVGVACTKQLITQPEMMAAAATP